VFDNPNGDTTMPRDYDWSEDDVQEMIEEMGEEG
jgi:hypothetical protein